jgi:Na+-transporting methylmalonyl-CoA/oxaloacetate decarboxylase gamma subunit
MEHSLSSPRVTIPWRTATLVAAGVATVELALLIVLGAPMVTRSVGNHVRTAAEEHVFAPVRKQSAQPGKRAETRLLPRTETSVVVLNGNGRAGAARLAGDRAHARGYLVASTGNAPRSDYARTIVMYRPGRRAEAERLAKDVGAKVVAPLDGLRLRDLMGAHVALVLGAA